MNAPSQKNGPVRNENLLARGRALPAEGPARRECRPPAAGLPSCRIVLEPLLRYDPININYEEGTDAYLPESRTILARLGGCRDAEEVRRVVREELCGSFGSDAVDSGHRYEQVAREIWKGWEDLAATDSGPSRAPRLGATRATPHHDFWMAPGAR